MVPIPTLPSVNRAISELAEFIIWIFPLLNIKRFPFRTPIYTPKAVARIPVLVENVPAEKMSPERGLIRANKVVLSVSYTEKG